MPDAEPQPEGPGLRLVFVDGDTTSPLSAEALVVALFAALPAAHMAQVMAVALAVQVKLDQGQRIALQANRVLRPDAGANGLTP